MASFEELGLGPELVDALASEGFESPSTFQEEAIPIVRRGNNLVARAGPGAGLLVAFGAPLLDRIEPGGDAPSAVVLVPTAERAEEGAGRLSRLARSTGHAVAALHGPWALPERADVLFATPEELLAGVRGSVVKLDRVRALVVNGAAEILGLSGFAAVETLAEFVPADAQRVLVSLPLPDALDDFVTGHVKRAVNIPPKGSPDESEEAPHRGDVHYRIFEGERIETVLASVSDLLEDGAHHVLVHFHSDDEAADVGDELTLHRFAAGAPGDPSVPVWLGTDERESRKLLDQSEDPATIATLSTRVPMDSDSLDLRHARGRRGVILVRGRELPHLKQVAGIAGYGLEVAPARLPSPLRNDISAFRDRVGDAVETADLAAYLTLLEPLFERYGAAAVAAGAAALLRERSPGRSGAATSHATAPDPRDEARATAASPPEAPAWVRLFMSIGEKDEAGPGDVLGAITGEAGIEGSKVGKIDIRETFSIVEVDRSVADRVIAAMNGITVKGRSLRVDFHRPRPGRAEAGGRRGRSRR